MSEKIESAEDFLDKIVSELCSSQSEDDWTKYIESLRAAITKTISLIEARDAAIRKAVIEEEGRVEHGWLIETKLNDITYWWTGVWGQGEKGVCWTHDPNECVRFARKQDAEEVIAHTIGYDDCFATEHLWIGSTQ